MPSHLSSKLYLLYDEGHKKAIGELISVSANRINEWLKIWSASNDPQYMTDEVVKIMTHAKISTLSSLVSALHRSGWSPENTSLPTSFPTMNYTKIENIPSTDTPYMITLPQWDFSVAVSVSGSCSGSGSGSDEGSLCDDAIPCIGIDECSPLTLSLSSPEDISYMSIPDKSTKKLFDIEVGSPSDLENWFDIVERNFEDNICEDDKKLSLSSIYFETTSV